MRLLRSYVVNTDGNQDYLIDAYAEGAASCRIRARGTDPQSLCNITDSNLINAGDKVAQMWCGSNSAEFEQSIWSYFTHQYWVFNNQGLGTIRVSIELYDGPVATQGVWAGLLDLRTIPAATQEQLPVANLARATTWFALQNGSRAFVTSVTLGLDSQAQWLFEGAIAVVAVTGGTGTTGGTRAHPIITFETLNGDALVANDVDTLLTFSAGI